jgi:hypothetical protein
MHLPRRPLETLSFATVFLGIISVSPCLCGKHSSHNTIFAVGLEVMQKGQAEELVYNKENLLNPEFLVA